MSPPNFHKMEDSSVHYDSTKSLVTIRDGIGTGNTSVGGTVVKEKTPISQNYSDREPTVNEIL